MKKILFVLPLIIMSLVGCKKDDESSKFEYPKYDYFPLEIGNKWEYNHYMDEVVGAETINGEEYVKIKSSSYEMNAQPRFSYFRKTIDDKVYKMERERRKEHLVYDFSIGHNQSWTYQMEEGVWQVSTGGNFHEQQIHDAVIKDCITFTYDLLGAVDDESSRVFAPGVGQIIQISHAWRVGDTLKSAVINGVHISF